VSFSLMRKLWLLSLFSALLLRLLASPASGIRQVGSPRLQLGRMLQLYEPLCIRFGKFS
jgi:hypothetical protein